jgi:endonuclease-3
LPAVIAYQYIPIMAKIIRPSGGRKSSVPSVPKKSAKKAVKASPKLAAKKAPKPRLPKPKSPKPKPWTPAEVHEAFSRFRKANPEPKGELEHLNPYTLLVAVVLSAQATDAGVNKATRALFAEATTPEGMLALGEDRLRETIKTIGLYRNKAKNVIALCRRLIEDFGGNIPQSRDELETLPGVGRKTANVVLNVAFGQPTIAVDTHLFRVANRIGLSQGKTPLAVEEDLERQIPQEFLQHAHHWLILHGRYVCKARKPECPRCLIADLCLYPDKTTPEDYKPARIANG